MSIFIIPAMLALIAKLIVIFVYRNSIKASTYFKLMVLVFGCHNLCEVLVFFEYFRGTRADYLLRSYYVISLFSLLTIVLAAADISKQQSRLYASLMMTLLCTISLFILFTDLVIAGSTPLAYVVTAVHGDFYWVFQVTALVLVTQMLWLLYLGYSRGESHQSQIRCVYTALALMPQVIAVFLVILLMNLGFQINGAVIFPFATTLFLFIMAVSESRHQMTDIRRFIPYSDERRTSNQIMEIFSKYAQDQATYRDSVSEIEKLLVEHKYDKNDRNATYAAERMGMPRSSLYSLFNRLDINKD